MKTISICAWRRPQYTKQVLDALRNCNGIENYTIYASVDGPGKHRYAQAQVIAELERVDFCETYISVNDRNLGCNQNTLTALTEAFRHSDYVLHVEDDVLLYPDALQYFEWAQRFETDPNLFIVSCWRCMAGWLPSQDKPKPLGEDFRVGFDSGLGIWGWGTWKSRWEEIQRCWTTEVNDLKTSWDCWIDTYIRGSRFSLAPHISRSLNIGVKDGTHGETKPLEYWAGSPTFIARQPPQFFLAESAEPAQDAGAGVIEVVEPGQDVESTRPKLTLVYPYCNKDANIALKNIQWMYEMHGAVNYPIILAVPADILPEISSAIEKVAVEIFTDVELVIYRSQSTLKWPAGANVAFQTTARRMQQLNSGPWLWLEPDAVPLRPDWLDAIDNAYATCGKSYFGPIVPGRGHMNGVAVYPPDMAGRCPRAMGCTTVAWDWVMRPEMIHDCFDASEIIQHCWGIMRGKPHPFDGDAAKFPDQHHVTKWVNLNAAIFHRCKDGSLISRLRERKTCALKS